MKTFFATILSLLLTLLPLAVNSANLISFDATSHGSTTNNSISGTLTQNHTVSGSNPILICYVAQLFTTGSLNTITASYNGISMTQLETQSTTGPTQLTEFELINPPTGTNTARTDFTFSQSQSWSTDMECVSYDNVGTVDAHTQNTGSGSVSLSMSSANDNVWFVAGFAKNDNTAFTDSGVGTSRAQFLGTARADLSDSNGALASGSHSIGVSGWTAGDGGVGTGLVIAPFVASAFNLWQFFAF